MLTDPGQVRQANEDACAADPYAGIFVVCDGMGGAAAGEVASQLAVEILMQQLAPESPEPAHPRAPSRLTAAIEFANRIVFQKGRQDPRLFGMGTTLVALFHTPESEGIQETLTYPPAVTAPSSTLPTLWLAHVGDSRCYRYRNGTLTQLTADHSIVEEQLRAGQITPAEAARSPMRNLITRAIGSQATIDIDLQGLSPEPGDLYLLASDGLTRELTDSEIATSLAEIPSPYTQRSLGAACQTLIHAANHHGGRDNITVLLLAFLR